MKTRRYSKRSAWESRFWYLIRIKQGTGVFLATGMILFLILLSSLNSQAGTRTIDVPMTLDYDILNALAADVVFTEPGRKASLVKTLDGCQTVTVSDPRFVETEGALFLEMRVHVQYGLSAGSSCLFPVTFDGYLVARNQPVLDPDTWQLRFETLSSHLETRDRNPARLADFIWQRVQNHLPALLDGITIDLGMPQKELGKFLQSVLPADKPKEVLRVIESLRPGPIEIRQTSLRFLQQMDIPETIYMETETPAPTVLTQEQKQDFIAAWETWDAFVVHMITALSSRPLTRDEQHTLLDVILKLRYAFSSELDKPDPNTTDFVRKQFILSWELLSPVFQNHLTETGVDSMLGYLAFFSAADTLTTLDRLGPLLGLDISRNGLLQLAALLTEGKAPLLHYAPGISQELIKAVGLGKTATGETRRIFIYKQISHLYSLISEPSTAWADTPKNDLKNAQQWILQQESAASYLEEIIDLVSKQAETLLQNTLILRKHHAMFRQAILATAWQESCFRQFIEKNNEIMYLRSYNQTSVGIMQINERVWRGIYDQQKLRWDIAYNAMTGCKIFELYLNRYALPWLKKQPDSEPDTDFLAGMLYAMYNGGPGHLKKYVQRTAGEGSNYLSDRLFQEKWEWAKQGDLGKAGLCLTGRPITLEK